MDGSDTPHGFLRNVDGSVVTIDYPGAIFTTVNGINSQGDVVGRWDDANDIRHSFLRTWQGTITSFDPRPAPCVATTLNSAAHGINDRGDVVGRCFDAGGEQLGWLLRRDGSFAILDDPSFLTADGWAIDNSRVMVGDYSDANEFVHGFTWTEANVFTTLDFENNLTGLRAIINQGGDISGIYFDGLTLHGFLRPKNGTDVTIDLPAPSRPTMRSSTTAGRSPASTLTPTLTGHGYIAIAAATATAARGINEKVEAVGRWDDNTLPLDIACSAQCHGFLWAKGELRSVDVPGANSTVALARSSRSSDASLPSAAAPLRQLRHGTGPQRYFIE